MPIVGDGDVLLLHFQPQGERGRRAVKMEQRLSGGAGEDFNIMQAYTAAEA